MPGAKCGDYLRNEDAAPISEPRPPAESSRLPPLLALSISCGNTWARPLAAVSVSVPTLAAKSDTLPLPNRPRMLSAEIALFAPSPSQELRTSHISRFYDIVCASPARWRNSRWSDFHFRIQTRTWILF